jgi:amino acid adenylation domain-containing protein
MEIQMNTELINGYLLSPQQRNLWLLGQDASVYRAQCAVLITGDLDKDVLREALRRIIDKHEILRTTFHRHASIKVPVQVVMEAGDLSWRTIDIGSPDAGNQEDVIEELLEQERRRPIDCEQGPLVHACLATIAHREHMLVIGLPSLCADTVTLKNFVQEIVNSYGASTPQSPPTGEPLQYADFSAWQNELLEEDEALAGKIYWREKEVSASPPLTFPLTKKASAERDFEPRTVGLTISSALAAKIRALISAFDISLEAYFFTCWQTLLWRLTAQSDYLISVIYDGRRFEELQGAFGLIARSLPIACHLDESLKFSDALRRAQQSLQEAYEWQDYYFNEQETLPAESRLDRAFAAFEFEDRFSGGTAAGVSFFLYGQRSHFFRFQVKLCCAASGDSFVAKIHYDSATISSDGVTRLLDQFQTLLESSARCPDAAIGEPRILSEPEWQEVVLGFNESARQQLDPKGVHELFEKQVERTPNSKAVIFEEEHLTYDELNKRANQLAHYLLSVGIGPEKIVAICLERSPDMIVGLLGILKAGAAYLALDSSYPKERLAFMLEDARASALVTKQNLLERLPRYDGLAVCLDTQSGTIGQHSRDNCISRLSPENLSYVIYTSGSTGKPKGTAITHMGLLNYLTWCTKYYPMDAGFGAPLHSSIGFDLTITSLFPPLLTGKSVVLVREDVSLQALSDVLRADRTFSLIKITPSHLDILNRLQLQDVAAKCSKALVVGGEALKADTLTFWRERSPDMRIFNEYGPTEAVVGCCVYEVTSSTELTNQIPIGKPITNTRLYITDRHMAPVPIGVAGELLISSIGLARGYLNRPDLTAASFIPDPLGGEAGARLYKTGDLARYLPDGNIEFLGRIDQQVKIRGFRIEIEEIEEVLKHHPAVREAVAMAREDAPGDKRLVAYVVYDQDSIASSDEMREFLREHLPEYMLPSTFVSLDALPLTPNGKVDRDRLPTPAGVGLKLTTPYVAPGTAVEEVLADIWAELLNIERVGMNDKFFELGGDSLLIMQVLSRIHDAFQIDLAPRVLFDVMTVAELATFMIANEPAPGQLEKAATLLNRVKAMSEEDVDEVLQRREVGGVIA